MGMGLPDAMGWLIDSDVPIQPPRYPFSLLQNLNITTISSNDHFGQNGQVNKFFEPHGTLVAFMLYR